MYSPLLAAPTPVHTPTEGAPVSHELLEYVGFEATEGWTQFASEKAYLIPPLLLERASYPAQLPLQFVLVTPLSGVALAFESSEPAAGWGFGGTQSSGRVTASSHVRRSTALAGLGGNPYAASCWAEALRGLKPAGGAENTCTGSAQPGIADPEEDKAFPVGCSAEGSPAALAPGALIARTRARSSPVPTTALEIFIVSPPSDSFRRVPGIPLSTAVIFPQSGTCPIDLYGRLLECRLIGAGKTG